MATLNTYLKQVQRLLREQHQELFAVDDLIEYINDARREVAERTQCIRFLTPISGSVISATVNTPGASYTNSPTISITAPDFPPGVPPFPNGLQATAVGIVQSGTLAAVDIQTGGYGYFQPLITVTDSSGSGAAVTANVSPINLLQQAQERYNFSDINVSTVPGIDSVYAIRSANVIYANYRYQLPMYSFSEYQAKIRTYPFQYQYVPAFCSQFGQGAAGSFYVYPLPSQTYQIEYDCSCIPSDLTDNQSVEALPQPWQDACKFYAAHLAYLGLQNLNAANYYLDLFDKMTLRKSQYARVAMPVNRYGRY